MGNSEEEYLLKKHTQGRDPYFDAPDSKILAFDMFRGPSPGFFSDIDLDNPGDKIIKKDLNE